MIMKKTLRLFKPVLIITILILFTLNTYGGNIEKFVVKFVDATTAKPIQGVEVEFTKKGHKVTALTDERGYITIWNGPFTEKDNKNGLIDFVARAEGYATLKDKSPCNQREFSLSPGGTHAYRIVLHWGRKPEDLDSHLWFRNNHIFYQYMPHQRGTVEHSKAVKKLKAYLDVDDVDSYGPETVTIHETLRNERYYYYVHDYTNRQKSRSNRLSAVSDARVYVYKGKSEETLMTFRVPSNGVKGNLWKVFYIDTDGKIVKINSIVYTGDATGGGIKP